MVRVAFACGHEIDLTGDESRPVCVCGETRLLTVKARAPRFRGHALGPNAQLENLPAKAVTLVNTKNQGPR